MNRITKVYLKNIFTQKGIYICIGISALIGIIIPFITEFFVKTDAVKTAGSEVISVFTSGVGLLQVIYITLFVCSDFTDGAAKNYIARGYTRRQILFSKFIASLIAVAAFYIFEAFLAFVLYAKNGIGFEAGNLLYILGSLTTSVAVVGLYVIIANTAEKLGTAIVINIMLPNVIGLLLPLANKLFDGVKLENYWIANLTELMSKAPTVTELIEVVGIAIVYLIILFEVSNYIIKKKEVK